MDTLPRITGIHTPSYPLCTTGMPAARKLCMKSTVVDSAWPWSSSTDPPMAVRRRWLAWTSACAFEDSFSALPNQSCLGAGRIKGKKRQLCSHRPVCELATRTPSHPLFLCFCPKIHCSPKSIACSCCACCELPRPCFLATLFPLQTHRRDRRIRQPARCSHAGQGQYHHASSQHFEAHFFLP